MGWVAVGEVRWGGEVVTQSGLAWYTGLMFDWMELTSLGPSPKSQAKSHIEKEKRNSDSELSLKSYDMTNITCSRRTLSKKCFKSLIFVIVCGPVGNPESVSYQAIDIDGIGNFSNHSKRLSGYYT